jgi:hypothetical protein
LSDIYAYRAGGSIAQNDKKNRGLNTPAIVLVIAMTSRSESFQRRLFTDRLDIRINEDCSEVLANPEGKPA